MAFLIAAVVLVGVLCLVVLVLTLAIIRRLRNHTDLIDHLLAGLPGTPGRKPILHAGERVGDFSAVTTDGRAISRETLTGSARTILVGFFSPDCDACHERLPGFVHEAERSDEVLAVVVGPETEAKELADSFALYEVAQVVLERPGDPANVSAAFEVQAFPAVCVVNDEGLVVSGDADEHAAMAAGTAAPNGAAAAAAAHTHAEHR